MQKRFWLICLLVTALSSAGWLVVSAQTWIMSPSPPPDNTTLTTPSAVTGDQMGRVDPHKALLPLYLSDTTNPRYRLYNIRSSFEFGQYFPALTIYGRDRIGLSLSAEQAYGLRTASYSAVGTNVGLKASNAGGYAALVASSTSGLGAKLFGTVTADQGYILGNTLTNQLVVNTPSSDSATAKLYWGNQLICNPSSPTCGWVPAGATGDGLGNHKASTTLDMNQKYIYNVGSAGTISGSAALMASALEATTTIDSEADDGYGVYAYSNGTDANNSAGLYATTTMNAPGITGASWLGRGLSASTPLQLLNDTGASGVLAALRIGETSGNTLSTHSGTAATTNLYWGNQLLCDSSKPNCGWSSQAGNASFWADNAFGINNPNLGSGGKVLLSRTASSYTLDVGYGFDASVDEGSGYYLGQMSGISTVFNDLISRGQMLFAVNDRLRVIDVSVPAQPKFVCPSPGCAAPSLGGGGWGIALSGSYAYVATTAGVKVIDISKPYSAAMVGSGLDISGISLSDNYSTDIALAGRYAYVVADTDAHGTSRLVVVDTANPASLQIVKTINAFSQPRKILIQGNSLVVIDKLRNIGVAFYDITDPINPVYLGHWSPPVGEEVASAAITNGVVYAVGTRLYAISLANRTLLGNSSQQFTSTANSVIAADGFVFVGGHVNYTFQGTPYTSDVSMFKVQNPAAITFFNDEVDPFYQLFPDTSSMIMTGSMLYISDRSNRYLKSFAFQGTRFPQARITAGTINSLHTDAATKVGSLTADSLNVGASLSVEGAITTGDQGLFLGGLQLDSVTLNSLRSRVGLP